MIQAMGWVVVVLLWLIAAAFAVSGVISFVMMIDGMRMEQELAVIFGVGFVVFVILGLGAGYAAMAVGRCL